MLLRHGSSLKAICRNPDRHPRRSGPGDQLIVREGRRIPHFEPCRKAYAAWRAKPHCALDQCPSSRKNYGKHRVTKRSSQSRPADDTRGFERALSGRVRTTDTRKRQQLGSGDWSAFFFLKLTVTRAVAGFPETRGRRMSGRNNVGI